MNHGPDVCGTHETMNRHSTKRALFISRNLIGDSLYISPALNAWYRNLENPDDWDIYIQTNDDYIQRLYWGMGVPITNILYDGVNLESFDLVHEFDINKAFAISDRKKVHVAEAYAELFDIALPHVVNGSNKTYKYAHLKPIFVPDDREPLEDFYKGRILVSMFSASCASRKGMSPNKMLYWQTWEPIIRYLRTLKYPLGFIGGEKERAPLAISEDEYLLGIDLNKTARIMQHAKLLVSVDNGMGHLAASQETPTFLFYPLCLGLHYILPIGNPNLVYAHVAPTSIDVAQILRVMKESVPRLIARAKKG